MTATHKTEIDNLVELRKHASDTRAFLSNKNKPERERSISRAFLRTIGVSFKDDELVAPTEEPADVAFRSARFQIREMLEFNRRRGDEWRNAEKKYLEVHSLDELMEPYSPPTPVGIRTLVPKIVEALSNKSNKYGSGCNDIDALVYINFKNQFLTPIAEDLPKLNNLHSQGWRSVSLFFPPYGVILFATSTAPSVLVALKPGKKYMEWQHIDTLFKA